ncbi:hypothetical protein BDW22DRAFT_1426436 [Trametopsis cervina]|nr:hypothetical protein BDW22DRAFT_1426436 [Trametopsis cervina]
MERPERSTLSSITIVATCTLSMVLTIGSLGAASIALPTIGRELDIVEYKLQWILSAFNLSSGCLLLLFGRLADLYGRKRVFLLGIAFLSIFSVGAGFAQDEVVLDVLRGVQGIGSAAVIPASLGILAHSFPPSRARSLAFATFAAGAPMGAVIGSLIGGALTQITKPTWRSGFFLIGGMGFAAFIGGLFSIDKDEPYENIDRRVDWLGAFLITAGLVFLCFALADGPIAPSEWTTSYILALLILGFVLVVAFLLWQYYLERLHENQDDAQAWWTPPPIMKISVWGRSKGRMTVILWIAFFQWSSFQSSFFWAQLYYQNYLNLSPVRTMLRLLPMAITGTICNVLVAVFVGRVRFVILIVMGTVLTGCAALLYALINPALPYWAFGFPAAIISVFGSDFVFAAGTLFVAKISLPHEQSLTGALFQTMTQLGTSFGLAITTILFNTTLKKRSLAAGVEVNLSGSNAPQSAQLDAYKAAMWGAFGFGMFGAVLGIVFLRSVGIVGHSAQDVQDAKDKEEENGRTQRSRVNTANETPETPRRSDEKKVQQEKA